MTVGAGKKKSFMAAQIQLDFLEVSKAVDSKSFKTQKGLIKISIFAIIIRFFFIKKKHKNKNI